MQDGLSETSNANVESDLSKVVSVAHLHFDSDPSLVYHFQAQFSGENGYCIRLTEDHHIARVGSAYEFRW